jgi:hypothetical protein
VSIGASAEWGSVSVKLAPSRRRLLATRYCVRYAPCDELGVSAKPFRWRRVSFGRRALSVSQRYGDGFKTHSQRPAEVSEGPECDVLAAGHDSAYAGVGNTEALGQLVLGELERTHDRAKVLYDFGAK